MTDTTLYLRFPDKATFMANLPVGFVQTGETGSPLPIGIQAMRIVGPMYTDGVYDAQGNVLTPTTLIPGWHVNVLGTLPTSWVPYQIFPVNPQGVFG